MFFYVGFPIVIASVAVIMDLRNTRVDNGWILFCMITGISVRVIAEGLSGLISFLSGAVFPLLLLGVLFVFRMLGPGDIKLFCALGGILGPGRILKCIILSFFLGAGISLALLISNGDFRQRFQYLFQYICELAETGKRKPYYKRGMSSLENFHFTVPIFLSIVLYAGGIY